MAPAGVIAVRMDQTRGRSTWFYGLVLPEIW